MFETTDNIAGVRVFDITSDQAARLVSELESTGAREVKLVTAQHVPDSERAAQTCITGRCFSGDGGCFAANARSVLYPKPYVGRFDTQHCLSHHCNRN